MAGAKIHPLRALIWVAPLLLVGGMLAWYLTGSPASSCKRTQTAIDTYGPPPADIMEGEAFQRELERCDLRMPES